MHLIVDLSLSVSISLLALSLSFSFLLPILCLLHTILLICFYFHIWGFIFLSFLENYHIFLKYKYNFAVFSLLSSETAVRHILLLPILFSISLSEFPFSCLSIVFWLDFLNLSYLHWLDTILGIWNWMYLNNLTFWGFPQIWRWSRQTQFYGSEMQSNLRILHSTAHVDI